MAYRPTWQGHLKLSLVTCPVALYTAVNSGGDVHFNLINPKTNNRIRMITTDPETGPIDRSDLVKGFEVEKGRYILVTDEEVRSVRLESTRTIEIERFVPAQDIDRVYWDHPYYLAPDGKLAQEAFAVIREAMERAGQVALGRVVLSTRERLLGIEPRGKGMVAYSLRTADEVRKPEEIFAQIGEVKPDAQMIQIAERIIEQQEGPFDPSQFVDRYEEALKALIAEKQKGHKPVAAPEPEDTNVVDLMSALRASLQGKAGPAAASKGAGAGSKKTGAGSKGTSERTAAKSSPRSKTHKEATRKSA
ncbi:MAG TPA: Ku protein [Caulobacteraceae bacterium]|jgi:DNA end-binding protein Ku|nr:Ku protein [Caulobacteraceae bacterium]